ncbi:MAG: LysR family transcriptional regulator [Gammaproteobacteria bacterium]|nr:MAG: LysR family transcriptional regulator [Gammaproteobacteria bacterium]
MTVALKLNLTRAAEELHLSQSSVSEQVQNLEENLKAKLFERSTCHLELTEVGKCLHDYATRLLSLADEAQFSVQASAGVAVGKLSIGVLETICSTRLPSVIATYNATHPSVSVGISAANTRELLKQLKEDSLDICFVFGDHHTEKNLNSEIVHREELVLLAPSNHSLSTNSEVPLEDLMSEIFLVTETGCVYAKCLKKPFPSPSARPALQAK